MIFLVALNIIADITVFDLPHFCDISFFTDWTKPAESSQNCVFLLATLLNNNIDGRWKWPVPLFQWLVRNSYQTV